MQKWEYLSVAAESLTAERTPVRYLNGKEIKDWQKGSDFLEYWNSLGNQGWELISTETRIIEWEYFALTAAYPNRDNLGVVKMTADQVDPNWKTDNSGVYLALQELGRNAWELINTMWRKTGEGTYADPIYYFKRPQSMLILGRFKRLMA